MRHKKFNDALKRRAQSVAQKAMAALPRGLTTAQVQRAIQPLINAEIMISEDTSAAARMPMLKHFDNLVTMTDAYGGNVFDMSPIAHLFEKTDVDDIPIGEIDLPYPALYLHFGSNVGLEIEGADGFHIEGAYIVEVEDQGIKAIAVMFTCNFDKWDEIEQINVGSIYSLHTFTARAALTNGLTVKESLELSEGLDGDPIIWENSRLVQSALRMTVNSLLYIGTPKAEIEQRYPEEAPRDLVERVEKGNWKAGRTLKAMGFVRTNFCGNSYRKDLESSEETGRVVEPHWRRGHWRRVAIGEGRSERLWHLFPPVIVNAKMGAPKNEMRVYDLPDEPEDTSSTFKR